tara:strand:- start:44 stop:559 length:516 start_codon:yes stop_codon:yes gene_type:complete
MPVTRAFPDAVTTVDTTEQYDLGTEWHMEAAEAKIYNSDVSGPQCWRYVFNDEASTAFAAGDVIVRDALSAYDGVLNTDQAPRVSCLGVAQHAIAAGSYGWILKSGVGLLKAGDTGNDQANNALVTAASGDAASSGVDVFTDGEEELVIAHGLANAGASAGATFLGFIDIP